MPEPQAVEPARIFKSIGDPVRLRLSSPITSHDDSETCVCDLTGATISHHLKVPRESGLITGELTISRRPAHRIPALRRRFTPSTVE